MEKIPTFQTGYEESDITQEVMKNIINTVQNILKQNNIFINVDSENYTEELNYIIDNVSVVYSDKDDRSKGGFISVKIPYTYASKYYQGEIPLDINIPKLIRLSF